EIRGEFKPVASSVPGLQVCEHLPRLAKWMHRGAVVRSVNHKAGCHNPLASYSGYEAQLGDITITRDTYPPSMGSVCEYLKPPGAPPPLRSAPSPPGVGPRPPPPPPPPRLPPQAPPPRPPRGPPPTPTPPGGKKKRRGPPAAGRAPPGAPGPGAGRPPASTPA